jgi:hypothetical protein
MYVLVIYTVRQNSQITSHADNVGHRRHNEVDRRKSGSEFSVEIILCAPTIIRHPTQSSECPHPGSEAGSSPSTWFEAQGITEGSEGVHGSAPKHALGNSTFRYLG